MRISDWSSDVCSSDLADGAVGVFRQRCIAVPPRQLLGAHPLRLQLVIAVRQLRIGGGDRIGQRIDHFRLDAVGQMTIGLRRRILAPAVLRSEEHTSELQSLLRISYAVLCLQKQKTNTLELQSRIP